MGADPEWGGAREGGNVIKWKLKVKNERMLVANFKTLGWGSRIVSSTPATGGWKGKTTKDPQKNKNPDSGQGRKLPAVKIKCSGLAEDALKAALADYQKKSDTK